MSLTELSRRANVDVSTLSRIERRIHHTMTLENLARIAQALGTSVTEVERLIGRGAPVAPAAECTVDAAVNRHRDLTESQKRALLAVFHSFLGR